MTEVEVNDKSIFRRLGGDCQQIRLAAQKAFGKNFRPSDFLSHMTRQKSETFMLA